MAEKLRVGVVGTGGIFQWGHLPVWREHPEIELVALCDVVLDKAMKHAAALDIDKVYANYHDLIAQECVDVVDVCTPNLFHSEIAVAALEAGKHVFCEKPDAVSVAEAQKMAAAAKSSGRVLMTMRNNRFTPAARFLRKYIDAGHFGEIYTGRCGWLRRRGIPGKGGWFTTKSLSGGGPLIDLGVHMIDVAMWLMGNPKPVTVSGATYCKFANTETADSIHSSFGEQKVGGTFDVEDLATGFIRFENGATLQVECSWASNIEQESPFFELRGTKAGSSYRGGELKVFTEMEGTLCDLIPRLGTKQEMSGHGRHLHHFVDVLRGRAERINTPEQGIEMIRILAAMYESAARGAEVRLA